MMSADPAASSRRSCPECGADLPPDHKNRSCPQCLLRGALSDTPATEVPVPGTALPRHIGDYEILSEIGRGGSGIVYRARHRELGRIVALKTVQHAGTGDPLAFERLRMESQAIARLDHPQIVPLYEVGTRDGILFLTLRYFEHGSLADALKRGRLDTREAVRHLATIARAVHHAHTRGVLHRDLKPSNILLDEAGIPHVADFGLAKLADHDNELTLSTSVLGTPAYMAPEQAAGHTKAVATQADVYSLGAMLFELLTGRPPFIGRTALEVMRLAVESDPPRLRALVPTLDRDLEAACLRCLEKEPDRRYGSAALLADDLERWLRHVPLSLRPLSRREQLTRWVRRRPLVAGLTAVLALAIVIGSAATAWQSRRAHLERIVADRQNYVASLSIADRRLQQGDVEGARQLLFSQPERQRGWEWGRLLAQAHEDALRLPVLSQRPTNGSIEDLAVDLADNLAWMSVCGNGRLEVVEPRSAAIVFRVGDPTAPVRKGAFSADGRWLLTAGPGPGFHLWNTSNWTSQGTVLTEEASPVGITWATASDRFLTLGETSAPTVWRTADLGREFELQGGTNWFAAGFLGDFHFGTAGDVIYRDTSQDSELPVQLWHADRGEPMAECPPDRRGLRAVVMAADGRHYGTVHEDGRAGLWRVGENQPYFQTPPEPPLRNTGGPRAALPAPQRGRLAVVGAGGLKIWNVTTGELLGQSNQDIVAWNAGFEAALVTSSNDGLLRSWDWETGTALSTFPLRRSSWTQSFAVDASGRAVAAVMSTLGLSAEAAIWPLAGTRRRLAPDSPLFIASLSPDGQELATPHTDGQVRVWTTASLQQKHLLQGHQRWALTTVWSQDGRHLFTGSADHSVRRWESATGRQDLVFRGAAGSTFSMDTSPDGDWLGAGDTMGHALLWDAETADLRFRWQIISNSPVWNLKFSPNGSQLAGALGPVGSVWDTKSGERLVELRAGPEVGHDLISVAFSPDGERLVAGSNRGVLRFWDTRHWRLLAETPPDAPQVSVVFTPDGERLLVSVSDFPNVIGHTSLQVRDGHTGERLAQMDWQAGWSPSLSLSADGQIIARSVLARDANRSGIILTEAFPWRSGDYDDYPGSSLEERIRAMAQERAWQRMSLAWSPRVESTSVSWIEPRTHWPARSPDTPVHCLDLTSHYNRHLGLCGFANGNLDWEHFTFAALPQGNVRLNGVDWDIRGLITTGREESWRFHYWGVGRAVTGIPVKRVTSRLHFLHAAWDSVIQDDLWGRYRLHYADGSTADLELRARVDIGPWVWVRGFDETSAATIAWEGAPFPPPNPDNHRPRLYHRIYDNPHPEREIVALDLIADGRKSNPFVVAITVDQ